MAVEGEEVHTAKEEEVVLIGDVAEVLMEGNTRTIETQGMAFDKLRRVISLKHNRMLKIQLPQARARKIIRPKVQKMTWRPRCASYARLLSFIIQLRHAITELVIFARYA